MSVYSLAVIDWNIRFMIIHYSLRQFGPDSDWLIGLIRSDPSHMPGLKSWSLCSLLFHNSLLWHPCNLSGSVLWHTGLALSPCFLLQSIIKWVCIYDLDGWMLFSDLWFHKHVLTRWLDSLDLQVRLAFGSMGGGRWGLYCSAVRNLPFHMGKYFQFENKSEECPGSCIEQHPMLALELCTFEL